MPSALKAIFSADSTEFTRALKVIEVASAKAGQVTVTEMRQAEKQLQMAALAAKEAGQSTQFYDSSLKGLRSQILQVQEAELRLIGIQEAAALKRARIAAASPGMVGNIPFNPNSSGSIAAARAAHSVASSPGSAMAKAAEQEAAYTVLKAAQTAEQVEEARRSIRARALRRQRQEEQAGNYAGITQSIKDVAMGGVGSVGGGGHGKTGLSGIIGEMLVITREIGRGNFARVPGSITILAQRLGLLGIIIKSTAAESIAFAAAQDKLAIAAAQNAIKVEALAGAEAASTIAARQASIAQTALAVNAQSAAKMQAAAATVSLGPLGWLAAALIAVGAASVFVFRHYHNLATEMRNAAELSDTVHTTFQNQADALDDAAKSARDFTKWLQELNHEQKSVVEDTDEIIDAFKRQASAQKELTDLETKNAVAQIDLDEKSGKISHAEAVAKKTAIEKKAIRDEAAAKQAELDRENHDRQKDLESTQAKFLADKQAAQDAEVAANEDPNSVAAAAKQAKAKEGLKTAEEVVKAMEKGVRDSKNNWIEAPLVEGSKQHVEVGGEKFGGSLAEWRKKAEAMRKQVADNEDASTAPQRKLEEAKKTAAESKSDFEKAKKKAGESATAAEDFKKESPAMLAARLKAIDLENEKTKARGSGSGYPLTDQQRHGAYIGGPSVALLDVNKSMNHKLGEIVKNTKHRAGTATQRFGGMSTHG